jgi:hypothetical protein
MVDGQILSPNLPVNKAEPEDVERGEEEDEFIIKTEELNISDDDSLNGDLSIRKPVAVCVFFTLISLLQS